MKTSLQEIRNLVNLSPHASLVISKDLAIVAANKQAIRVLGMKKTQLFSTQLKNLGKFFTIRQKKYFRIDKLNHVVSVIEHPMGSNYARLALIPLESPCQFFDSPIFDRFSREGVVIYHGVEPVYVDDRLASLTGYSKPELESWTSLTALQTLLHPEEQPKVKEWFEQAWKSQTPSVYKDTLQVITKHGEIKWLEVVFEIDRHGDDVIQQALFIDVTRQKTTESQLRLWKRIYRMVAEASTSGIIITDSTHTILYANKKFAWLVKTSLRDMINKLHWYDFVDGESRERMMGYAKKRRTKGGQAPTKYHFTIIDNEGSEHSCLAMADLVKGTDLTVASFIDLTENNQVKTEMKALKNKFEAAFNSSPVAKIITNKANVVEQANDACLRVFARRRHDIQRQSIRDLVRQGILPSGLGSLTTSSRGKTIKEAEHIINGAAYYFNITVVWIKKALPHEGYRLLVFEDVTATVKARKMSSDMTRRILEAHEEEKKRISQEIHDTLSQSLAVYKMNVQRLSVGKSRSNQEKEVLLEHLNDIIETSRHIAHNLRPDLLDNLGLVEAVREYARTTGKRFAIEARTYINVDHVDFGPHKNLQLFRLMQEAITNTVKHGHATRVTVLIFKHGQWYTFLVRDNGIGFNVNTLTDNLPSNHLGMRIMQERASDIGAELNVSSEPGKGTLVRVRYQSK